MSSMVHSHILLSYPRIFGAIICGGLKCQAQMCILTLLPTTMVYSHILLSYQRIFGAIISRYAEISECYRVLHHRHRSIPKKIPSDTSDDAEIRAGREFDSSILH